MQLAEFGADDGRIRIMCHKKLSALLGALAICCALAQIAAAETLISETEAKLPSSPDSGMATRGLTRGPAIELISPTTAGVKSPLALKIKFTARNNVAIDPTSVKMTYLKLPPVDLTDRIKSHVTKDGIDMPGAEVPPGTHVLRVDLKDAEGRSATSMITLKVEQK